MSVKTYNYTTGALGTVIAQQNIGYDTTYPDRLTGIGGANVSYNSIGSAIGRVVYFVEKHWSELVKFSRRKEANLNRWAARYATISNTSKETYAKAKGKCMDRYVAVSLLNCETIEFRIFRYN